MVYMKRSPKVYDSGVIIVEGRFSLAGAGDPTAIQGKGIKSIVHTSTGLYTVTLDRPYAKLISATATLGLHSPADDMAQIGKCLVSGATPTIQIATLVGASVGDISADGYDDAAVNFVFVLREHNAP